MESCTNPLMMCTDAAARTKNIRLGQACNVITFHNPIRLAEDIATLDQMSKEEWKLVLEEEFMEEKPLT